MRQQKNQQNTKPINTADKEVFLFSCLEGEECAVKQQKRESTKMKKVFCFFFDLFRAENKLTENAHL